MKSINTSFLFKILDLHIAALQSGALKCKDSAETHWEIMRVNELKGQINYLKEIEDFTLLQTEGGNWLGSAREWIQRKFVNGSDVNWGSQDYLKPRDLTVSDIEQLASICAARAINEILR